MNVLISGGFTGPYQKLLPEFERTSGIQVTTGSGSSQGKGPQTIAAQLARGVPADVVILSREGLNELIAARRIVAGTDVDLARTPIGVAVRVGAAKPAAATVEEFKRLMLGAKTVAVPSSTSGIFLVEDVFPRLGIAGRVKVEMTPRGSDAARMVATGAADLGLLPVSEIVAAPGVELAGVIAEEIQLNQIFSAAAVSGSKEVEAAKRLIAFLASPSAAAAIRAGGMEPLGKADNMDSTSPQSTGWQAEIAAAENDANQAFLERDLARLDQLFSDELLVNSPINVVNDKKTLLGLLGKGIIGHVSSTIRHELVRRDGDLVIVMGSDAVKNSAQEPTLQRRFTNVWRREGGRWRLYVRHANVIAEPPGT